MLVISLGGCGFDASFEKLVVGNSYEHAIRAGNGGGQVPLPEGKWLLVGWDIYTSQQELGGVLIQTEGQHLARMIDFYVPYHTEGRKMGLNIKRAQFCSRKDVLYLTEPKERMFTCWGLNHWPMTFSGDVPKHLLTLRDHIDNAKLKMPSTMIAVQYRKRGNTNYISLNYYFNPELDGIPPPQQIEWRTSDWHRDRLSRDPARMAYIERLKEWGASWAEQVEKGIKGVL